jgi:2Fe-2S ferredoxin
MAKVVFIESDGTERAVAAADGASLMSAAIAGGVAGLPADCGGACSCATCHVHVDAAWTERVGGPSVLESSMLEYAPELQENSRLSCQITISPELEGLIVRIPAEQG